MKKLGISFVFLFSVMHTYAQLKTAQAYYDYIITYQEKVEIALIDFSNSLESDSATVMYEKLKKLDEQSVSMMKRMESLEPFSGHTAWRDAVKNLYSFYHDLCQKDYIQLIDYSIRLASLTEIEFNELTKMMNAVTYQENELIEQVNKSRDEFLKKFGPVKMKETK